MRRPARRPITGRHLQRGVVLLIMAVMLAMGGTFFIARIILPSYFETRRQQVTDDALRTAAEAVIGYAATYRERQMATGSTANMYEIYGRLPLPDLGTTSNANSADADCANLEGCSAANFAGNGVNVTVVGRFPWRKFGTGPLRDGHGECLWYAVSGSHQMIQQDSATPMNWDTQSHFDIVTTNDSEKLKSLIAIPHDHPVAIIFSPGPILGNQTRGPAGGDVVTECGGNYNPANYLEPNLASALLDASGSPTTASAYFTGNRATDTEPATSRPAVAMTMQGRIVAKGSILKKACSPDENCEPKANDGGIALTGDALFSTVRNNANFRTDINALLDRMTTCLRDEIAGGSGPTGYARIAGADTNACYGKDANPLGYYPNYKDLVYVARGSLSVNGENCAAALVFASQRTAGQRRDGVYKNDISQYLEGKNLESFTPPTYGTTFAGPTRFERISSTQSVGQDIVRCVPAGVTTVGSANLAAAGVAPLAAYSPASGTLILGEQRTTSIDTSVAGDLYGCAWMPETHAMGSGLRTYFTFRINDAGSSSASHNGFAFAIVDGDTNGPGACGAASHHMGYSGNNNSTPFIAPPKIAFEIDPRVNRQANSPDNGFYFNPLYADRLSNGRNDPPSSFPGTTTAAYRGGHVAFAYWGGETPLLATNTTSGTYPPCTAPRYAVGAADCYLPQEEDDNVHGEPAYTRAGYPAPPANPTAPTTPLAVPPDTPAGVYKLDPNRSQVPTNQDFHVRLELSRTSASFELPSVRVASTGHLDLSSPGTAIDGVYLATGDRVLVKNQTTASTNGVYVWNGGAVAMTRASGLATVSELNGVLVEVQQGSQTRTLWRQNALLTTLESDSLYWAQARAKVATTANITLSGPGASIDGIRLSAGDRVLVKAQTTSADNGLYLWNGASSAMTRATDADTADEMNGLTVHVQQGSAAGGWWRMAGTAWSQLSTRVASQIDINLVTPGANVDGIAMAAGDRVLVKAQTDAKQNGVYVWNGEAVAMTRAADAAISAQLSNMLMHVLAGTDLGRAFRQTALRPADTVGASAVQWKATDPSTKYTLEAWILPYSVTDENRIIAMRNTTRPMSQLYAGFIPHLRDTPTIGYPFRNVRLGFTTGQQTNVTDQNFTISNISTTWLD